jgi:anti-anti-sigma factor
MPRPYRHIEVACPGDVFCVRLRQPKLDETALYELCDELTRLVTEDGCRKLVLSLGPPEPQFLYSIFLAKLVTLQRRLKGNGGALKLCEVGPETMSIFDACGLARLFEFYPDQAAALKALAD